MDMKVVAHAKNYIDALAKGINPLNGEVIPEGEVVRQEKMIKCLGFVASVLDEVYENGGVQVKPSERDPFVPQMIDFSNYQDSQGAITITGFLKRMNACKPKTMRTLGSLPLLKWMEEKGFLEKYTEVETKERTHYMAGRRAAEIGITEEQRKSNHGYYTAVLYSQNAQRFLISHLAEIVNDETTAEANKWKKWELEEDRKLLSSWENDVDFSKLAEQLSRSPRAIRLRLEKLIVDKASKRDLTDEEKRGMNRVGRLLEGTEQE